MQAIPKLVKLFNHSDQEVQRHATGAMRNLIYDSPDNKMALMEENGVYELLLALKEQDDELRKNVTGKCCPYLVEKWSEGTARCEATRAESLLLRAQSLYHTSIVGKGHAALKGFHGPGKDADSVRDKGKYLF